MKEDILTFLVTSVGGILVKYIGRDNCLKWELVNSKQ